MVVPIARVVLMPLRLYFRYLLLIVARVMRSGDFSTLVAKLRKTFCIGNIFDNILSALATKAVIFFLR